MEKRKKNLLIYHYFDNSFPTKNRGKKNIKLDNIFFYTRPMQNLSISISIRSQVSTFFLITYSNLLRYIYT